MTVLIYNGSFDGLLTVIFIVYEQKLTDVKIYRDADARPALFGTTMVIETQSEKARRVYNKLRDRLTAAALNQFYCTFLSELATVGDHLLGYVQYVLSSKNPVESNYSHPDVLMLQQTSRRVNREKHRMEAFVRFQLTKDKLFYSIIQPDFNVLPLITKHLKTGMQISNGLFTMPGESMAYIMIFIMLPK